MPENYIRRLRRTTAIYWMLLAYVIAALVWWFISLNQQNEVMRVFEISNLKYRIDSTDNPDYYHQVIHSIDDAHRRNRSKYVGEGVTFFLIILVGAAFVYRSVRRQFRLQQQQQNFVMAVTHELKTPISVARLNLETMQKYSLEPEKQKKLIRNTLDETTRLNFLTNNILVSSQLESRGYKSAKEELDLSDLMMDCIQDFRNRYPDRQIQDQVETEIALKGDALLLQMLINNLLENAIKYSPKETPITAVLKKTGQQIRLSIKDKGPGIPDDEKKKIFAKFYRVGNEATRTKQGTGLGLYLCRKIARNHRGEISVANNEGGGSIFLVTFDN